MQEPLRSEMGWTAPDGITVWRDPCNDLLGKIDLAASTEILR